MRNNQTTMEMVLIHAIILGVVFGLTSGAAVLPESVDAALGGAVVFNISLPPIQTPFKAIAWDFENINIFTSLTNYTSPEYEGRITLFMSTGSLELRGVSLNDTGQYRVTITPASGPQIKGTTRLKVYEKVTNASVTVSPPEPVEGMSVNLTCDASGSILTREWTKDGSSLKPSENIVFYDQNRVLCFKNLNRKDTGTYTCKISNPVSSQEATYVMNVNYGPENVQISGPKEVQEKTKLELSCSADSVPASIYTWIKNGTTIGDTPEYIKDITEFSDSGDYICRTTNSVTDQTSNASHTVFVNGTVIVNNNDCSTGCIVGIVFGCIAFVLLVSGVVFYILKKKKLKKSVTRTVGEDQDNTACSLDQAVNYADVRFMRNDGGIVNLGAPTYNAHMQRVKRAVPQSAQAGTEYAEVRKK